MPAIVEVNERTACDATAARPRGTDRAHRVCHVSMHLKTGGLERLLVEFARRHDRDRFSPMFVALQDLGRPADDIRGLGCDVISLDMRRNGKRGALRMLCDVLVRERVSVVHTHNTYAHYYGSRAARRVGTPILINSQHGRGCGAGWRARLQFVLANRQARQIVGVSRDAAALCRGQDPISASKISAIWNGIDVERFQFSGPRESPVAIAVARLSPEKDFSTLLRGMRVALQRVPDLRLRIVGDGQERAMLEALAAELGIAGRVEFLGERSDVPELLREAAFFVSSSKSEGISLTLLEAMAVGLPVLATRVGGNGEVVEEGVTGRLVAAEDPTAFAAALVRMCEDRELWAGMGQCGRARVERHFEVGRMVREYEALYERWSGS